MIKCNDPRLLDDSWKRYLLGFLREATPFQEVPVRLILRSHEDDAAGVRIADLELHSGAGLSETQTPVPSHDD